MGTDSRYRLIYLGGDGSGLPWEATLEGKTFLANSAASTSISDSDGADWRTDAAASAGSSLTARLMRTQTSYAGPSSEEHPSIPASFRPLTSSAADAANTAYADSATGT
ncbi:unnamed protein product, partial [Protopolystoma xenopodis]